MDDLEIKVWAQMFFEDGSVSQGKRYSASVLGDESSLKQIALQFLDDLNRTEGFLLVWGAGLIIGKEYVFIDHASESDS